MQSIAHLTLDKDVEPLRPSEIDAFAAQTRGGVLSAADDACDEARKVWNATADRRPALIASSSSRWCTAATSTRADDGRRAAAPVLQFGDPIASALGPTPYTAFQSAFDPLLAPGSRNDWKTNNFRSLGDAALDVMIAAANRLPGPACEIFVAQLGGAMARVAPNATAFVGRDAHYIVNAHGRGDDAGDDARVRRWTREAFEASAPHATGSGYVNFLTEDEAERVAASYGENYARLRRAKRRFDPGNLFRMSLNVEPAAAREVAT